MGSKDVTTEALFRRADAAVREGRLLVASLKAQRERAQGQMRHLHLLEAELFRPTRILYPSDVVGAVPRLPHGRGRR